MPKYNWTRVQFPNGEYGYVKTDNNDKATEYKSDGTFKVYSQPDEKSRSFYTSFETRPHTIQRVPDDHEAHLAQQKQVDEIARNRTDGLSEGFANLITLGAASTLKNGTQDLKNGHYISGGLKLISPFMIPAFAKAPGMMVRGIIGGSVADAVSNNIWANTFGKGKTFTQDISDATNSRISEEEGHILNPATWWGFKTGMNSHRWRPNGTLGMNNAPTSISKIFERERWNRFRNPKYVTKRDQEILESHFPEYKRIQEQGMDEGTYMIVSKDSPLAKSSTPTEDGKLLYSGDEGTWIQSKSKDFLSRSKNQKTEVGFKGGTDQKEVEGVAEAHAPETFPLQENGVFFAGPRGYADTYNRGQESPGFWLFFRNPYDMLIGGKRAFPLEDNTVRFARGVMSSPSYKGGELPLQTYNTINKAWNADYLNNPEIVEFLSRNPMEMSPSELIKRDNLLRTIRQGQLSENEVKFNKGVESLIKSGKLHPLRSQYYDGFIGRDHALGWSPRKDFKWPFGSNPETYVIFKPEQAKLLVGNNGAFSDLPVYSRKKGGKLNRLIKIKSNN